MTSRTRTTSTSPIPYSAVVDHMRERVPPLALDSDEWVRRMMRWHFSPATGSPFWLARRVSLSFDPIREVTDVDSLALFGLFDKRELRGVPVRDLLPRGFTSRPLRVLETGGTTGLPYRIPSVTRTTYDVAMYRTMLEARGLAGGDMIAMIPSGPHMYAHFVMALADSWGGAAYFIDFDPRWVKLLVRQTASTDEYVQHLVDQTLPLLWEERPALLFTTSKLLLALVAQLPEPLGAYGVQAVCTGGTSVSLEEARYLREEHLAGVVWIDTYGNTLMGHALQADAVQGREFHSYHLPPPLGFIRVVHPNEPGHEVPAGERGQVLVTALLEDLLIPNLLERDSAVRVGPHPWFPWDGVAQVRPELGEDTEVLTEGVY